MKVLAILANQFKRRESLLAIAFLTAVGSKYSIIMRKGSSKCQDYIKGLYQGMISRDDINNENYVREPR